MTTALKANSIKQEVDHLNAKILSKLISSTHRSPHVRGEMEISDEFFLFMKDYFGFSGRFTDGSLLLDFFKFETERFFNENDYCDFAKESFKIRLSTRRLKYNDHKMEAKLISLKKKIHFKLTVRNGKIF
jgi:hypothetical protein